MILHAKCMELDYIQELLNKNLTLLNYCDFEHVAGWKVTWLKILKVQPVHTWINGNKECHLSQFSAARNRPLPKKNK